MSSLSSQVGLQFGVDSGRALGERAEAVGQGRSAVGLAGDDEQSVVPRDRAQDVGEADLVQGGGEELRGAGRRAQDGEVGAALGVGEQVGQQPGEPGRRGLRGSQRGVLRRQDVAGRGAVASRGA